MSAGLPTSDEIAAGEQQPVDHRADDQVDGEARVDVVADLAARLGPLDQLRDHAPPRLDEVLGEELVHLRVVGHLGEQPRDGQREAGPLRARDAPSAPWRRSRPAATRCPAASGKSDVEVLDRRRHELLLGAVAAIERGLADAGALAHPLHRQRRVAAVGEQVERRPQDGLVRLDRPRPPWSRGSRRHDLARHAHARARAGTPRPTIAPAAAPRRRPPAPRCASRTGTRRARSRRAAGRRAPARPRASRAPVPERETESMCSTVPGGQERTEHRDAERAARHARRVVDRRADAHLGLGQRAHDRVGGRRHRRADAEAHQHQRAGDQAVARGDIGAREQPQRQRRRAPGRTARRRGCRAARSACADSGPPSTRPAATGIVRRPASSAV